jgi:cyclopropane-fatty-acyl-phospholipid synthase
MANREEIEETYDFMDEIFRVSFGEHADLTCAMYNGSFSKTLAQAQRDKHQYILDGICFKPGFRVLDIGCGFGPVLKAVEERGGHGIGLTLSRKQAEVCRRAGLEVFVKDWKEITADTFGTFDGIVSVGAFEHFCSPDEYIAGKQDAIYDNFFRLCHSLLPDGGRLYLQTMMLGRNAPDYQSISLQAQEGSDEYIAAIAKEFFPGSWLPFGEEHILRVAAPYFKQISHNNGRRDYLQTIEEWSKLWNFTFSNFKDPHARFSRLFVVAKLVPRFLTDKQFRRRTEFLRKGYDKDCFRREIIDHQRMVFQKV